MAVGRGQARLWRGVLLEHLVLVAATTQGAPMFQCCQNVHDRPLQTQTCMQPPPSPLQPPSTTHPPNHTPSPTCGQQLVGGINLTRRPPLECHLTVLS